MMAPREEEGCARSGPVTGQRSLRGRGSLKGLQRALTNTMLFSDYHLAKLNPKCYMNYSIIFTEISFSPETSSLLEKTMESILATEKKPKYCMLQVGQCNR